MLRKPTPPLLDRLNIPSPWLFTGTVLISLGLHGAFLGLPLPEGRTFSEPETPELDVLENHDVIKIIPLPNDAKGRGQAERQSAPPPPAGDRPVQASAPPVSNNLLTSSTEDNTANRSGNGAVSQAQDTGNSGDEGSTTDLFSEFLIYDGAVQGSSDVFFLDERIDNQSQYTNVSLANVRDFYQARIKQDKFIDLSMDSEAVEDGFFEIYKVTNQTTNESNYLHLINYTERSITVIVMLSRPQTPADLETNRDYRLMTSGQQKIEKALANLAVEEATWNEVEQHLSNNNINPDDSLLRGIVKDEQEKGALLEDLEREFVVQKMSDNDSYLLMYESSSDLTVLHFVDLGNGAIAIISKKTAV